MRRSGVAALVVAVSTQLWAAQQAMPRAMCDTLRAMLRTVPSLTFTTVAPDTSRDICRPARPTTQRFSATGSMKAFKGRTPDQLLWDTLTARGWVQCVNCSADGPDGTVWGLTRNGIMVVVEGRWDGGDDSDPDAPLSDEYGIIVRCVSGATCEQPPAPDAKPAGRATGAAAVPVR